MAVIEPHTFAVVIREYLQSHNFKKLAFSTQTGYLIYLKHAEHKDCLGSKPVNVMRPALVQAFLDAYADRPGAQEAAKKAIKAVEKWALVRDRLPFPITTGTELVGSDGGHVPWSDYQVETGEKYARPDLARAITLAANTGQRGSDLIRMTWGDLETVDGRLGINVVQRKTKRELWIPLPRPLVLAMETWERRPTPFLLQPDGRPWTRKKLSDTWRAELGRNRNLAPLDGLVLHGLRGTACVRLKRAGASELQIADMVGMSPKMVTRYCRKADQKQNAIAAVQFLDRTAQEQDGQKSATVTPLKR